MGIRVVCPNGHKLNVKSFLAGKRGVCPHCGAKFDIPAKKADSSEERVQSVGQVGSGGGTATATVPSADSAEMRASHPVKGAGAARRGAPATAPAVPVAPIVSVTPAAQGLAPVMPMAPVAPVQPAAVGPATRPAAGPLPGTAQPMPVQSVPVQSVSVQPVGLQPEVVPGATPLDLAPVMGVPSAMARAAVVDPLAEAPEASWYVRPPSGGQYGPAKPQMMRDWLAQGRVTADSLVWREGWPDWKLAGATFPSLGATTPAAVAPAAGAPSIAGPLAASAAADDPFAVLGPGPSTALSATRRSRRSGNSARVMAIAGLCLALVILSALLVYVLKLQ